MNQITKLTEVIDVLEASLLEPARHVSFSKQFILEATELLKEVRQDRMLQLSREAITSPASRITLHLS